MKVVKHILIVALLTILTQVGGAIWILNFGFFHLKSPHRSRFQKFSFFLALYFISTILIIPLFAKLNNRVPLPIFKSNNLVPHNYLTPLLNRHYVKPTLKSNLIDIGNQLNSENVNLKVSYLDANFPFLDGFPLLPHLSHNDGRKVDLSFYYTNEKGEGNLKPANLGYGKYVEPIKGEYNQTKACKTKGYWHYDYTKYLTLGSRNDLEFDIQNTKRLIQLLLSKPSSQKLLIEPHLKKRMKLSNSKIRFQGCHAVRHDDHIHYQIN